MVLYLYGALLTMKYLYTKITITTILSASAFITQAKSTIGGVVFTNSYVQQYTDVNGDTVTLTKLEVADNSRFRVKWDNEDNVSMYIEMALRDDEDKDSLRHAYGKWDISETSQLLAGQTSTPFAPLNPSVAMVHNSGQGYGNVSPSRPSQIRYTYKFLNRQGALAVALVDPNKGSTPSTNDDDETVVGQRYGKMPRLDVGMAYSTFNWQIFPSFFYHDQSYTDGENLTSYGVSLGGKTASGPVVFSAEIGGGKNWGNTKMSLSGSEAGNNAGAIYDSEGHLVQDNDNLGYWIDAGYRFTYGELQGVAHFIYGSMSSKADGIRDLKSSMVGISAPIDLPWIARGLRIRPELFRFKDEDRMNGTKTSSTIFGVQLQYTF